jgi:hypothetical protein
MSTRHNRHRGRLALCTFSYVIRPRFTRRCRSSGQAGVDRDRICRRQSNRATLRDEGDGAGTMTNPAGSTRVCPRTGFAPAGRHRTLCCQRRHARRPRGTGRRGTATPPALRMRAAPVSSPSVAAQGELIATTASACLTGQVSAAASSGSGGNTFGITPGRECLRVLIGWLPCQHR